MLEQDCARHSLGALGPLEVVAELGLEHAVEAPGALLGAQLDPVVAGLATPHQPVLAGDHAAALVECAVGDALRALEEELHSLAPAEAADRSTLIGHRVSPL